MLGGITQAAAAPGKVAVAATILPLGDFCRRLGGDRVEVEVLIPPGASPHVFEPRPSVMARASRARVFVYIGAGLEPWADRLLVSRGSKDLAVVEAARGLPLLQEAREHRHSPEERPGPGAKDHPQEREQGRTGETEASHTLGNPHIWLDPVLAQEICRRIAAALVQADPEHRPLYESHLQKFLAELEDLHREIASRVRTWRLKEYVCFHPAYAYFARRYGLKEVGVIELAPGREPTPRHLQEIVATIRRSGIRVVFAEPQFSPRMAQVVAQEAGVKVLLLDPVGGRPPYGSDYLELMRYNLDILEEAMK